MDPWTKTAGRGAESNVGGGRWAGQGRVMGENGDNFNWTAIQNLKERKL